MPQRRQGIELHSYEWSKRLWIGYYRSTRKVHSNNKSLKHGSTNEDDEPFEIRVWSHSQWWTRWRGDQPTQYEILSKTWYDHECQRRIRWNIHIRAIQTYSRNSRTTSCTSTKSISKSHVLTMEMEKNTRTATMIKRKTTNEEGIPMILSERDKDVLSLIVLWTGPSEVRNNRQSRSCKDTPHWVIRVWKKTDDCIIQQEWSTYQASNEHNGVVQGVLRGKLITFLWLG